MMFRKVPACVAGAREASAARNPPDGASSPRAFPCLRGFAATRGVLSIAAALLAFGMVPSIIKASDAYTFTNPEAMGRTGPMQFQVNSAYAGGNQSTCPVAVVPFRGSGTVSVQPLKGKPSQ